MLQSSSHAHGYSLQMRKQASMSMLHRYTIYVSDHGVGRGRLESLSPAVCVSAIMSVAFDAHHGPWCKLVEYRMSNIKLTSRT